MRPVFVAAIVAVLLAAPSLAQNPSAPDPTPASSILYAASDSATDRALGWLSTDSSEGDTATVGGAKPEDCTIPGSEGQGLPSPLCESAEFEWTWTYTLSPALRAPLHLAAAEKIKLVAFLGAGTGAGTLSVTSKLTQGSTVIAEGPATAHEYANSPAGENYGSVVWDVPVSTATLAAGTDLVWTVTVTGEAGGSGSLFMAVGEPRGRSHIELPVIGGGSSSAPETLTGTAVDIQRTFNESTTKTLRYTWPGPATATPIAYATKGTGNATFVVLDAGNATLLNETVQGTKASAKSVTGAAGNWSITISLQGFNGTLRFTVNDPVSPSTGTGTSTGLAGNGTGDDDKKDTPLQGLPALLGAVIAAVILARRRR